MYPSPSFLSLSNQLESYHDNFNKNNSQNCILFADFEDGEFDDRYEESCELEIYGFAIIGGVALIFLVVSIIRVVVAAE